MTRRFYHCLTIVTLLITPAAAQQSVSLMTPASEWRFDNGREFPGATGSLTVDASAVRAGKPSFKLAGDFTKGGNYVQMGRDLDKDIRILRMWLRNPESDQLTMRIIDSSGQCHQLKIKTPRSADWQQITFPLADFFAHKGSSEAVTTVSHYENWGGAKDAKWHGPAKGIYILVGRQAESKSFTLWLNDITILEPPPAAASAGQVSTLVPIDMAEEGEADWTFDNGQEFRGATGSLTVVKDQPQTGQSCLKLSGDFTQGGAYVQMLKNLKEMEVNDVASLRLHLKTDNVSTMTLRLGDATGQCHQTKGVKVNSDGQWHDLVLKVADLCGSEHWSGANDGKWHGSPQYLAILLNANSDEKKQPVLYVASAAIEAIQPAVVQAAAYKADFENIKKGDPPGLCTLGDVYVDDTQAFKGKHSLVLHQPLHEEDKDCWTSSFPFKVTKGTWDISLAAKSDLVSPDASYHGIVTLDWQTDDLTKSGSIPIVELSKQHNWQAVTKRVEIPVASATAIFTIKIEKASGKFWVDELSAAQVTAAPRKDKRIAAILFQTAQLGNMIFPEDSRKIGITVRATKPLKESQLHAEYVVRDYWGAEQTASGKVELTKRGKKGNWFEYDGQFDLASATLEMGRYHEIHAYVPQENDQPFHNYTSLAILPEAATKKYKPEEIPFTGRDWDNRIGERFTLSDRIGIRICGVWGGWSGDSPYKPEAPSIEMCQKLGMGVLTGVPTHAIEEHAKGYEKYDERALRQGVRNWIEKYGRIRPLIINLGNEPHGDDDRVKESIKAYRIVYDEVKKIDPTITVLGTSCGPEERYFKFGFQDCCDAYDFHIYESYVDVKRSIETYRKLFKKYGGEKPIWSTELGLNAQGMTRQAVSAEMIKKFAVFFTAGGASVSWFDLLYPDPDGTQGDSNSSAFNVFDCRYCRYAPKLDAVTYYNMVNAICIKKAVGEKHYPGGINAYLFRDRDGKCLQVLWADKGRADVGVPLPGVDAVEMIGIDGRRTALKAGGKGVTLSVSDDPVLLLYQGGGELADALAQPAAVLTSVPSAIVKGAAVPMIVSLRSTTADRIELKTPPFWISNRTDFPNNSEGLGRVTFQITPPQNSEARHGDLLVPITDAAGNLCGQLSTLVPVAGRLSVRILPDPAIGNKPAGVKLLVKNNGPDKQDVAWQLALLSERPIVKGEYQNPTSTSAFFGAAADGAATVEPQSESTIIVPLSGIDPFTVYQVKATVTDASGRSVESQRNVSGFVSVPKARAPLILDGNLNEPAWKDCPVELINEARQYRVIVPGDPGKVKWNGPEDLSAEVRYLWDDQYLYLGVSVKEHIFKNPMSDDMLWAQDGLQCIIDPARAESEKPGKYDYAMGLSHSSGHGKAWCHLSATPATSTGEVKDIRVAAKPSGDGTGGMTYEIAIPWSRLAPFKPSPGANLGMNVTLNEDNGKGGRHSIMGWFGDVQSKSVDVVGDLIWGSRVEILYVNGAALKQSPHPALCRWSECLATTGAAARNTPPSGPVPVERMFGHYRRREEPEYAPIRPCAGGANVWPL